MSIFKENTPKMTKQEYEDSRTLEALQRYKKDQESKKKIIKPFGQIVSEIIGDDNYMQFEYKTGLSADMFYTLKKRVDRSRPCQKNTIVSLCIGYGVDIQIANQLLESEGSGFNPLNDIDSAYIMLLTEFRGKSVEDCNKILEKMEIPPRNRLGHYARKKYNC